MKRSRGSMFVFAAVLCALAQAGALAAQPRLLSNLVQGEWEGQGPPGEIALRISGESLHFFVRDDFWYEATFTLPAGDGPQQLHATITDSSPPRKDLGETVFAIVQLEDGVLSVAVDDGSDVAPESFRTAMSRYDFRRAPSPGERQ